MYVIFDGFDVTIKYDQLSFSFVHIFIFFWCLALVYRNIMENNLECKKNEIAKKWKKWFSICWNRDVGVNSAHVLLKESPIIIANPSNLFAEGWDILYGFWDFR